MGNNHGAHRIRIVGIGHRLGRRRELAEHAEGGHAVYDGDGRAREFTARAHRVLAVEQLVLFLARDEPRGGDEGIDPVKAGVGQTLPAELQLAVLLLKGGLQRNAVQAQ